MQLFRLKFELHFRFRSIQSLSVSTIRSMSCDTIISSKLTIESVTSSNTILSTTKSSQYRFRFLWSLPLLLCRVSMVKRKSDYAPLSTSVCSGQFQSSSKYGRVSSSTSIRSVSSRSSGRSQSSITSFPSFLSGVPLIHFTGGIHYQIVILIYVSRDAPVFR